MTSSGNTINADSDNGQINVTLNNPVMSKAKRLPLNDSFQEVGDDEQPGYPDRCRARSSLREDYHNRISRRYQWDRRSRSPVTD
jgi:hypothetical protein